MECVEFYDFIYNVAYPFEGGASSLSSVRNRRFYHREFSGNDDNGPMGTKISINGKPPKCHHKRSSGDEGKQNEDHDESSYPHWDRDYSAGDTHFIERIFQRHDETSG
ncbi:hypothetical protein [Paenibacillus ehimensis]|uniref:hypothetical protein n=1 Tax=Paenibacillus ehimensis TaxID=79264 RepID=UPI000FD852DB|nr:hypothetical protein [Paenibacillus ehimensis]